MNRTTTDGQRLDEWFVGPEARWLDLLVEAFFRHVYSPEGGIARSARRRYARAVTAFLTWYATTPGCPSNATLTLTQHAITPDAVMRFVDVFPDEPTVLRQHLAGLHAFGAWLVEQGHLTSNPVDGVPTPKPATRRTRTAAV